jgi:hypothetical protein
MFNDHDFIRGHDSRIQNTKFMSHSQAIITLDSQDPYPNSDSMTIADQILKKEAVELLDLTAEEDQQAGEIIDKGKNEKHVTVSRGRPHSNRFILLSTRIIRLDY